MLKRKKIVLTDHLVEYLGLYVGTTKVNLTPAEATPLVKAKDGNLPNVYFSYRCVVVILLDSGGYSCPDISYAINFAARYIFNPKIHMSLH